MQLNVDWNEIQNSMITTTISWMNMNNYVTWNQSTHKRGANILFFNSIQGNKYHNKDSSCVRWKCQDFQWIITKPHTRRVPKLDLFLIVLRFRTNQVFIRVHIEKMYRQINVHPQDRDLQSILWRYSSDETFQVYNLTTVTYGTSSAQYLATYCLKKLADKNNCQYPRATQVLNNDIYVEDLLSGTSTINFATKVQKEI